jgi:hypothetical protein
MLWLASALAAFDIDPWLFHPTTMVLTLPSRGPLITVAVFTATLGIAALVVPGWLQETRARVLVWIGGATALVTVFLGTPYVRPQVHFVAVLLALGSTLLLTLIWLRLRPQGIEAGIVVNIGTCAVVLVLMLLAGEAVFTLTPRSHAVGYTLAARLWFERYWKPRNALGYRDQEHVDTSAKKIFVLGDSFVSGLGLPDPRKRMSNLLQERLGSAFQVYNLGWNGADTREEYRRLLAHPLKPAVVILVYYLNDIEEAAAAAGRPVPHFHPYSNVPDRVARIIRQSYLLDFAYWQFPQRDLAGFEGTLESMYRDPTILALHLADLKRIVQYCRSEGIDLVVVAFPHLARPAETAPLLHPVVESLQAAQVPVIEVAPLIAGRDPRLFYVNSNDAHPNEHMNAVLTDAVANVLAQRLR